MFFFVRCTEYDESLQEFETPSLQESANDFLCSCLASTTDSSAADVENDDGMHSPRVDIVVTEKTVTLMETE